MVLTTVVIMVHNDAIVFAGNNPLMSGLYQFSEEYMDLFVFIENKKATLPDS